MGAELVRMGVEAAEGQAHDGDARLVGRELRRGVDRVSEGPARKPRGELAARMQALRRDHHVALDAQDVRERGVARFALGVREARIAQELLGIGERDRARPRPGSGPMAPGPTTTPSAAKLAGEGDLANARASHPASRYSSLFDAVSQISMERKCERFGCG